jgi:hypothetical protein
MEKNWKLDSAIEDLKQTSVQEFTNIVTLGNALSELDLYLLKLLNVIVLQEKETKFSRIEATSIFLHKDDLISVLNDRR